MLTAKDIMTINPATISPTAEIGQAVKLLLGKRINGLPVVDTNGRLVGIICQSDLIAAQKKIAMPSLFTLLDGFIPLGSFGQLEREWNKISAVTVDQAMTPDPITVTPGTPLDEIASLMVEKKYHTLPVVDGGTLVGVVGKEDVLKTLLDSHAKR